MRKDGFSCFIISRSTRIDGIEVEVPTFRKLEGGSVMKRILIGIAAVLLLFAGRGTASAQEGTVVDVGLKMWINYWTHDDPFFGSTTSDSAVLLGPAIDVNFPNYMYLQASYLFSSADYDFHDTGQRFDRQDLDVALGYFVVPGFGLETGYKSSWFKESGTGITSNVYGPILGIKGIAQVDPYLSFYGRLDYLFARFREEGGGAPSFEEDSPGWIFEFGVKYAFTREFKGSLGYKYETNEGNNTGIRDSFSGLTLSGMVSF
jgi:opacity protein-like surface antigen